MEEGKLEIKLTQLQMTLEKTNAVISSSNSEAIERHYQTLKTITADVSRLRLGVEAKKIEAKEQMEKIQTWNADIDAKLEGADLEVGKVRQWLDDRKKETE